MRRTLLGIALVLAALAPSGPLGAATPPNVGEIAPDFTLKTLDDRPVMLKQLTAKHPVVLVVLRGWPGYQCPICTRQVHEFVSRAADFKKSGAQVLMVYPGPAEKLKEHAQELLQDKSWPADFLLVIDPNYLLNEAAARRRGAGVIGKR